VNGGGRIEREYGLGRMRTDLLVLWPVPGSGDQGKAGEGAGTKEVQKVVIELKVLHKSLEQTLRTGLAQIREYMDRCGAAEGHLVIFDRRPEKSWDEKIFRREEPCGDDMVTIWGM
jgi:hypothetical protein